MVRVILNNEDVWIFCFDLNQLSAAGGEPEQKWYRLTAVGYDLWPTEIRSNIRLLGAEVEYPNEEVPPPDRYG